MQEMLTTAQHVRKGRGKMLAHPLQLQLQALELTCAGGGPPLSPCKQDSSALTCILPLCAYSELCRLHTASDAVCCALFPKLGSLSFDRS